MYSSSLSFSLTGCSQHSCHPDHHSTTHYLNGGIRINTPGDRVTAPVKGHLSVLLAILALIKATDYWYQRYSLNFSDVE